MSSILLTGCGSVENGWTPVFSALRLAYPHIPSTDPNLPFANIVFQLRWLKCQMGPGKKLEHHERARLLFKDRIQHYRDLKKNIAKEIISATNSSKIRIRKEIFALQEYLSGTFTVITTNWDKTIEEFATGHPLLYLHGNVDAPDSLYLPTEVIEEPYRESELAGSLAGRAMELIEDVDHLIIYGLSLSTLDIELGIVLAEGFGKHPPKKITIVDPNCGPVEDRLRFYLQDVDIRHITPNALRMS